MAPGRRSSSRSAPIPEPAPARAAGSIPEDTRRQERIPFERDGKTFFAAATEILAARADGHYTTLFRGDEELFCPWPISRVEETLKGRNSFLKTHRSYLVNIRHVKGFQRDGDKAFCLIGNLRGDSIPVSRSRIGEVRQALQLA